MIAKQTYQPHEFAKAAGVTVRALHHYDRLGLLKPERTGSGYRVYRQEHLARLEQIVALKFIGVPLKKIKQLLNSTSFELPDALRRQRSLLLDKRRQLDTAINAIAEAEAVIEKGELSVNSALTKIIEVMEMQNDSDWMLKYFSDEGKEKVQALQEQWTPEVQARTEKEWTELFSDIRNSLDEDPASANAQALVDRWIALTRKFTGGDPQVAGGVKRLYADQSNWPAGFQQKIAPFTDGAVWEFFMKALAARQSA